MNVWTPMDAAIKPLTKIYVQFKYSTVLHWHVVCPWCIQVIEEWLPHIHPRLEWPEVQEQHAHQWNTWRSHWCTISVCTTITTYRLKKSNQVTHRNTTAIFAWYNRTVEDGHWCVKYVSVQQENYPPQPIPRESMLLKASASLCWLCQQQNSPVASPWCRWMIVE